MSIRKKANSVHFEKGPTNRRSNSMVEEIELGEKNSYLIKKAVETGEILENYNLIIKKKAYEGLS
jgi:hypothetical protein